MGKSTKKLKSALQSQQSRFKAKEKLLQASHLAEQKSKKGTKGKQTKKGKLNDPSHPRRATIPFRITDKILLIGEGNFSFARALIQDQPAELQGLPSSNITATAYDTEEECYEKYPEAHGIVSRLREAGVVVLFGVDGTQLEKIKPLKGRRWDKIVWNFPHAGMRRPKQCFRVDLHYGVGKGITDQDRNILSNQILILGFLRSASRFLAEGPVPSYTNQRKKKPTSDDDDDEDEVEQNETAIEGGESLPPPSAPCSRGTILITLRNVPPYTLWYVQR